MSQPFRPLADVRVVEIGEPGRYAGKLLADLGATVVSIEPASVASDRQRDPASFTYYQAGKRCLTLEPTSGEFAALLRLADVTIVSLGPAEVRRWGLTEERLQRDAPGLVAIAISGFGTAGPRADWQWTDLIAFASGGLLYICGDPTLPPVTAPNQQAYHIGALHAAVAAVAALRAPAGARGTFVDISLQECLAIQEHMIGLALNEDRIIQRAGNRHGTAVPGRIFRCADGAVYLSVGTFPEVWDGLMHLLADPPELADEAWRSAQFRRENHDIVDEVIADRVLGWRKVELMEQGQALGIRAFPVYSPTEFIADRHVEQRRIFGEGVVRPPYLIDNTPLPFARALPPLEHDAGAILAEWSDSPRPPGGRRTKPANALLAGIRVLELGVHVAGPLVSRTLAAYGAEAIKIETERTPDPLRPSTRIFVEFNRGKASLTLNLKQPQGRALFRDLVAKSDVLVENLKLGTVRSLGLDPESLSAANPRLVQLHLQGLGSFGPRAGYVSFGPTLLAFSGLSWLWNHPSVDPPVGCQLSYPDYVAALHGALAILASLREREESDHGHSIELGQCDSAAAVLAPIYQAAIRTGHDPAPVGNRPAVGHGGVFRCLGDDSWVAIEVRSASELAVLAEIIGADLPPFDAPADIIERYVGDWTARQSNQLIAEQLQARGIPAAPVMTGFDLMRDDHLLARDFLTTIDGWNGPIRLPGNAERFDGERLPARPEAPALGRDTERIARDLLGLDETTIAGATESGALR